jgi:hypothetical protein
MTSSQRSRPAATRIAVAGVSGLDVAVDDGTPASWTARRTSGTPSKIELSAARSR